MRGVPLLAIVAALAALAAAMVLAWISWVAIGLGPCGGSGGSPNMDPRSSAAIVCEVQSPGWGSPIHRRFAGEKLYEYFLGALPVVVVAAGVVLSRYRRRWRPFVLSLLVGFAVLLLPWGALLVLQRRAGPG